MLAINYSEAPATGTTATGAIAVSGIKAGDILLACIGYAPTDDPVGVDVSEATVSAGSIALDTTDTSGMALWLMWVTPGVS